MLKDRVGIDHVERLVRELSEAGPVGGVDVGVRNPAQAFAGDSNHFVRNIHAMDFPEMLAEGLHQAPRPAPDFERPPSPDVCGRLETFQLPFDGVDHFGGCRQEGFLVLVPAPESYVVMRIFAGALVPIVPHPFGDFGRRSFTHGRGAGWGAGPRPAAASQAAFSSACACTTIPWKPGESARGLAQPYFDGAPR